MNSTTKTKVRNFATPANDAASPPKPKNAEITAKTKKVMI
jgi:hypothetical protein